MAPFDGEIVEKSVELGAFVGPGSPVFVVARTDLVKIVIGVPDTALPSVTLGEPVDVGVDAYGDRTFQARVSRMATAADPRTGNFEVEVAIANRDHALKAGMIGSLELAARQGCDAAGLGPGSALGDRAGRRRPATASTSSPVRRARRRRSCGRSRSAR